MSDRLNTAIETGLEALAKGFRDGTLRPEELAAHCAARHRSFGAALGAYKAWDEEALGAGAALAGQAFDRGVDLGALQGIPFSAKDLYGLPGLPVYAGSPKPLPARWERPGPVVNSLLRQLAVPTGKTHMVEFAFGGIGTNPHWGTPRNPWDAKSHRVPGGSSAGAGVGLIEGSSLLALGTDTAGSVRIPASMTGTVGLKPTYGRWPLDGIVPLSTSVDTPGLLARSVKDVAWAFTAIEGGLKAMAPLIPLTDSASLRMGVPDDFFWEDCSPGVERCVREALRELEAAGAGLQRAELPDTAETYDIFKQGALAPPELLALLSRDLPEWLDSLDSNVRQRLEAGRELPAWAYIQRRDRLREIGRRAAAVFDRLDAIAVPTVPVTPPTLEMLDEEGAYRQLNMLALRNTCIANLNGLCAISMPVGLDAAGMPVGLMLMSAPGGEERLLSTALAAEAILGRATHRLGEPPLARPGR